MNTKVIASSALALAFALGTTSPGHAQATKTDEVKTSDQVIELDAFVVEGSFRGSLAAAAEIKRMAPVILEAIAAEDIGKLPDTSIAESLARLPGLTSQRINSRAQGIVIRGLDGNFNAGLLNGREQVSTGSGRSVEFDQYPAELLSGVVVYKTGQSSLVSQGIGGTINMKTVRPLSHGKRSASINTNYEWSSMGKLNPDSDDSGLNYSLSYIDQVGDGNLGIAIGYSHTDKPGQGEQWNAWGYPTTGAANNAVIGGAKPFVRSSTLERDSLMAVIESKHGDNFRSTIDLFFSDFSEEQRLRGIEFPFQWGASQLQPGFTVDDGLITQSTWRNVYGVVRNDFVGRDAEVRSFGWNLDYVNPEGWSIMADLSYSKADRNDLVLETYSGTGSNLVGTPDTLNVTMGVNRGATFTPTLDYTNTSLMRLTSPQGWGGDVVPGGQVGFLKGPISEDELQQYRLVGKRDLNGFFRNLEVGLAYTHRTKSEVEAGPGGTEGFFLSLASGQPSGALPPLLANTSLDFIGIPGMISYDPVKALNSGIYTLTPNPNPAYVANNWEVAEDIYLQYVQLGIDRSVGNVPVTGSLGVQLIESNQRSTGLAANGATVIPVDDKHDYVDVVPSLNLNFRVAEGKNLRFSLARQLFRQTMNDMRAGSTFSYNQTLAASIDPNNSAWSGSGGNPEIEPWRANSVDLSYEHYFKDGMGYWSVGAFYKDLRSYTYRERTIVDFSGYPIVGSTTTPATSLGLREIPRNGNGGNIKGLEFTLSLPGEKFSSSLSGFGLVVGAALTSSSIQPNNGLREITGLSDKVVSTTVYYEKGGFAARLSNRYRSDYVGDISTFGPRGAVYRILQAESVIDAQISYAFREGALKGFTIVAQGYNLTDEPLFATASIDTRQVQDYQLYGAQYSLGVSYKF